MFSGITTGSPYVQGGQFHHDVAAGGAMRPGLLAPPSRVEGRYSPPPGPSGVDARLIDGVPGHARAQRVVASSAQTADEGVRAPASLKWYAPKEFRAHWTQPWDVDLLPEQSFIQYQSVHAPGSVLRVHAGTSLFRMESPDALVAGKAVVSAQDGDTGILNHLKWIARDRVLDSLVSMHAMDQFVGGGNADGIDATVKAFASLEHSHCFKPPRMKAHEVSPNCLKVWHSNSIWEEAVRHPDMVPVEIKLGELPRGAQVFLVSARERHGWDKARGWANTQLGKPPARYDKRLLMVALPAGVTSVTMAQSKPHPPSVAGGRRAMQAARAGTPPESSGSSSALEPIQHAVQP